MHKLDTANNCLSIKTNIFVENIS